MDEAEFWAMANRILRRRARRRLVGSAITGFLVGCGLVALWLLVRP